MLKYHLKSKKNWGIFRIITKSSILDIQLDSTTPLANNKKIWLTSSRSHSRIFLNSRLVKTSSFFRFAMIVEVYPYSFTSHGWWKWTLEEAPQQIWMAEVSYKTGGKSKSGRFILAWLPLNPYLWYILKLSMFNATTKL